jgi:hypothetical protein
VEQGVDLKVSLKDLMNLQVKINLPMTMLLMLSLRILVKNNKTLLIVQINRMPPLSQFLEGANFFSRYPF